jgi:outer membrane protein assembly factor BamB
VQWEFKTGGGVHSSPAVSRNYVYVGSGDNYIYCLNKDTGELKWKNETGALVQSSPAVSGNYVYIGSWDAYVYAFSTEGQVKPKHKKHEKELAERRKKLEEQKRRLKELEEKGFGGDEEFKPEQI